MKAGWRLKSIGDICDVVNGGTPKTGVSKYWDGSHQWITPAEMGRRNTPYINRTERTVTDEGMQNSSARLLPPYSVILSSRAPIGHLAINTVPMATNQGCKGLVPRGELEHKFLYYYLRSIVPLLNDLGTGATFKELSSGKLKEVTLPFPSLLEQQRIVAIIDDAFDGIAAARVNAEQNLQNARALFDSSLEAVFAQRGKGWVKQPLSDLCDIKHGYAFKSEFFTNQGDYVLLTPGNFNETGGYRDRGEKQKYYCGDIPRGFILEKGDLLVAMTEQAAGLLGSPILVPESGKFLHNQRLGLVISKPNMPWINEFFFYVFNTQIVRKEIHNSASGVKVRHTSPTKLGDVIVTFPVSVTEQLTIVSRLQNLQKESRRLESLYKRKLHALDELKKSLLHQAFSGELTKNFKNAVIVPFPTGIAGITATDLHAGILAMGYQLHEKHGRQKYFGHVKAEKVAHMIEALAGIDLGRVPFKDAAGPNDFQHLQEVGRHAEKAKYFSFKRINDAGYRVTKHRQFDSLIERTRRALGDRCAEVDRLLELMLPMNKRQAEIFCTVYAAWNNLLLDRQPITDERIVLEAREYWHPDKLKIPREKFFSAIEWIRSQGLSPQGRGKIVRSKASR